jgi:transcription initiation factor TFIIB
VGVSLGDLNALSRKLSLPDAVMDEAGSICKSGLEKVRVNRRSLALISASSFYAACRMRDAPISLEDVALASGVGKTELAKCYRLLVNELDLKIPVADPAECLARIASRAKVSPEVEAVARETLSKAAKAGITAGVHSTGLAASALYLASLLDGQSLTQQSVAEAAGVRETTVRRGYKRLRKVLGFQLGRPPRA